MAGTADLLDVLRRLQASIDELITVLAIRQADEDDGLHWDTSTLADSIQDATLPDGARRITVRSVD